MKLVLKVSGNEVTTGSSSLDTVYDEQPADYDKPKEKKKKKKKDKEKSLGSPEDDKGKKKVRVLSVSAVVRWETIICMLCSMFVLYLDDKEEERSGWRRGG